MTATTSTLAVLLVLLALLGFSYSWSSSNQPARGECRSRRDWLQGACQAVLVGAATTAIAVVPEAAVAMVPTPVELERLPKGHARVRYLLDHWDEVTKVCGTVIMSDEERKQIVRTEGGGGTDACSKTPLRVQEFMGYKSTTDPLYRVDKLMVRAGPLVDLDNSDKYLDAVERYREKADNTSLMAYTSSWGEANP